MSKARILVIEDDPDVVTMVSGVLKREGWQVKCVPTARQGREVLGTWKPEVIVLDLNLPDQDGIRFCEGIKQQESLKAIPVFMLTARGSSSDIVEGLEAGAEDYLPKPFNNREFVARLKAILRRGLPVPELGRKGELIQGDIHVDLDTHEIRLRNEAIKLTLREFELLRVLMQNPDRALKRDEIKDMAWGPQVNIEVRAIDVHMTHLRKKLESAGTHIETVPQVGYRFRTEVVN